MAGSSAAHRHRHFKTLIALVVSMTGGTLLLYWIGQLAPVIPLQSKVAGADEWRQITVRPEHSGRSRGFFHFRIDEAGRVFRSSAWKKREADPASPGTIEIVLSVRSATSPLTRAQTKALSRLVDDLRKRHSIPGDRVAVAASRGLSGGRREGPRS